MSVALTRLRCINALRCYSYYALSHLGLVRSTHMPLFVSVEPAAVCQLHCPECPVGRRENTHTAKDALMSEAVWHRTLTQIAPTAMIIQFYFQGEPLLHPHLPTMIHDAHEQGLYTIVSTNAQAMTEAMAQNLIKAGLDRIIISMDGLSDESYNAYRIGGSLEKTKSALMALRKAKDTLHGSTTIVLQCLRLRTNEHEWALLRHQYRALGADRLVFKTAQLYDYADGHPLMPTNPRYSRYIKGSDGHYHRRAMSRGCLRVYSGVVVTTTGEVLPCCYDKAHHYAYGNIMDEDLHTLFNNAKARSFRIAAMDEKPLICRQCYR